MASETPSTKFLRDVKGASSDYGGSDVDEALLEAASQFEDAIEEDIGTNYGSDFDSAGEEEVTRILAELDGAQVVTEPLIEEENESGKKCLVYIPLVSSQGDSSRTRATSFHTARESAGTETTFPDEVLVDVDIPELSSIPRFSEKQQTVHEQSASPYLPAEPEAEVRPGAIAPEDGRPVEVNNEDKRSPIQRFRTPPKKPLSVTDIVSPAWCELQYWFSLTKFGKVKRTPAMKQGTKVHKELEKQVHTYVEIDVKTKEDTYGLRMWNIIQGLRTLRATGLTRELEIWGVVDGEVVNGVIDELSYDCPDPELESSLELSREASKKLPAGQKTIGDFYSSQQNPLGAWLGNPHPVRKIYVTDIKTRGTKYMPTGAALRGVEMQLMLYHKLLTDLASNLVPADTIFSRYRLDPHRAFSASFINNIAELEGNFIHHGDLEGDEIAFNAVAELSELSQYNSLTRLWSLMITEFQRTIPTPDAMSSVLQAEFRKGKDGKVMGNHCFVFDSLVLDRYVSKTLDWWKGRREARGVDIEEAYKCQGCEFAVNCHWRKEKVEEGIKKFRERKRVAEKKWKV